jgi:hypothetical protein
MKGGDFMNDNRKYWESLEAKVEEGEVNDFEKGIYNDQHISDLEELASLCPFEDLSEKLIGWARAIECRIKEVEEREELITEEYKSNIDKYFKLEE